MHMLPVVLDDRTNCSIHVSIHDKMTNFQNKSKAKALEIKSFKNGKGEFC